MQSMDETRMSYSIYRLENCPILQISISLYDVLELVNEGFTATGLPGLPPSCHLMGSRLPKPHLANSSASVFLDFNLPNVLQLPSTDYLNKSMTRPESLTELQQTWWYEMCMGGYERKCCQTGGAGNYYWAVACRTKSCWQARPSGMFRQKTQEMPVGHPPSPPQTDASTNTNANTNTDIDTDTIKWNF